MPDHADRGSVDDDAVREPSVTPETDHPPHSTPDHELIDLARAGDRDAYGALWTRHAPAARRMAHSLTRAFDADDLVAEAFTKIFAALKSGGGPTGSFRPYLYVTIRNIAVRWASASRTVNVDDTIEIADPRSADLAALMSVDSSLAAKAFQSLPTRWQQVLWLTVVEDLKPNEIAERLNMQANGVAALSYRAREGLKQAWVQAHVDESAAGSEHQWVLQRVGKWARSGLTKRDASRMEAHLAICTSCAFVAAEARTTSAQFTDLILPAIAGFVGAAGLALATTPQSATASPVSEDPDLDESEAETDRRRRAAWLTLPLVLIIAAVGVFSAILAASGPRTGPPNTDHTPTMTPASPPTGRPRPPLTPTPGTTGSPAPSTTPGRNGVPPTPTAPGDPSLQPARPRPTSDPPGAAPFVYFTDVDHGGGALDPIFFGSATPGSTVSLTVNGRTTAAMASSSGAWRVGPVEGLPTGTTEAAAAVAGAPSASTSVTVSQPKVSTSFSGGRLVVRISGIAGTTYSAHWDGERVGSDRTGTNGDATVTARVPLSAGVHVLRVQAFSGDRTGPATVLRIGL